MLSSSGSTAKTLAFLNSIRNFKVTGLESIAQRGVSALQAATPVDSNLTASSWGYTIEEKNGSVTISFTNSNIVSGVPVAILLQYGHGTGTGGYVTGQDYINPAIQPVFDALADELWKKVTNA